MSPPAHFADALLNAIDAAGAPVCVGLDPVLDRLPAELAPRDGSRESAARAVRDFSIHVLDAVAGVVPAVKPQSACYERFGAPGLAALEDVCRAARDRNLLVILDVKRGDIGVTADHYAHAAFNPHNCNAHAATVSPYLGLDTLDPWLAPTYSDRGLFVLVRTSNPHSDLLQSLPTGPDNTPYAHHLASLLAQRAEQHLGTRGFSSLGAVVAATKPHDAAALRALMPKQLFLVPGFGAQGGDAESVRNLFLPSGHGAIITASRSVLYPTTPSDAQWRNSIRSAAQEFAHTIRNVASR